MSPPARGLSTALIVLMGLTAVAGLALAGFNWGIAPILIGAALSDGTSLVLVMLYTMLGAASGLLHLAAGITFIVWMFRSRGVADTITSTHQHRWSKPWTIASWFVPLVNLWVPYAAMQDIWRGSDRTDPLVPLKNRPGNRLLPWWWTSCLVSAFADIGASLADEMAGTPDRGVDPDVLATWITVSAVALASAALLATQVIRQIEARQNAPVTEPNASPAPAA